MYATVEDYLTILGVDSAPANIETLLQDASDLLDAVTLNKTADDGPFGVLTEHQIEMRKKATVHQVDYWVKMGTDSEYLSGVTNLTAGTFSAQFPTGFSPLAPRARRFLINGGFLFRGVAMKKYNGRGEAMLDQMGDGPVTGRGKL